MPDGATMMLGQMGAGGGLGFIIGYAVRKIMEAVILIVGTFFVLLFGLASTGAVTLNYDKLYSGSDVIVGRAADFLMGTTGVLLQHFPITAGFGAGFFFAMRRI